MVDAPETRYARTVDGVHVAYSTVGSGPIDILICTEWTSNLDLSWEYPELRRFPETLAHSARVISMSRRGTGTSDPVSREELATIESSVYDVTAVLDAAASTRCALVGFGHGGQVAMVFAATRPERVSHLVLVDSYARASQAPDYPHGFTDVVLENYAEVVEFRWGTGEGGGRTFDPEVFSTPGFSQRLARFERLTASPAEAGSMQRATNALDVRSALDLVAAPTLVVFLENSPTGRDNAQYLAEHIAGARFVELPGYHYFTSAKDSERLANEVTEFVTGEPVLPPGDRILATVLFTDLAQSTEHAVRVGDAAWRYLLDRHDAAVRRQLERFRGREIKSTGDGFLAVFDGPARACRCATAIRDVVRGLGLDSRAGLHCGEIELRGDDVAGVAVNLASRVGALAEPGEVLVSSIVVDLVAGSGIEFRDRGEHELKGLPGRWRLLSVER